MEGLLASLVEEEWLVLKLEVVRTFHVVGGVLKVGRGSQVELVLKLEVVRTFRVVGGVLKVGRGS